MSDRAKRIEEAARMVETLCGKDGYIRWAWVAVDKRIRALVADAPAAEDDHDDEAAHLREVIAKRAQPPTSAAECDYQNPNNCARCSVECEIRLAPSQSPASKE